MEETPHYKITPASPVYQIQNNIPRYYKQITPAPNYKKRKNLTTYQEKHTIDFHA